MLVAYQNPKHTSSSMIAFSCSNASWADGLRLRCSWNSSHCLVFHSQATIGTNIYGWNTINSILSIGTYINTSIILLPTILLSLLCSTLIRTIQSLCLLVCSCAHLAWTRLAGITFDGLVTCSAISISVARFISSENIFGLCPSFNLNAIKRQHLYEICPYTGLIVLCLCVCNPIYYSSKSSCSKGHLIFDVRIYCSFRPPFLSMRSISSSQCLTFIYEAWSWFEDRMILLPFNTQWITIMNVVFGNSVRLPLAFLPTRNPKSVAGH